MLHYLTMDNVFHCLAAYGGEEIGLQFAGLLLSPFLDIGLTRAFFQSSGMVPCYCKAW